MSGLLRLLAVCCVVAQLACGQPKATLSLALAKEHWRLGESLWYRVSITNSGGGSIEIDDPFWFFQNKILDNARQERGAYLVVVDSSGTLVSPSAFPFGMHGETRMWSNDCGNGVSCEKTGFSPVRLARRESLVATPSIEAPLRGNGGHVEAGDVRVPPDGVRESDARGLTAIAESAFKYGDSRFASDSLGRPPHYPGYRILDSLSIPSPGKYRIKAVLRLYDRKPALLAESAWLDFEVFYATGTSRLHIGDSKGVRAPPHEIGRGRGEGNR